MNAKQQQQKKINVKLDEKVGEGVYSNFFMVTYSPSEFVLDFGRIVPGLPDAKIYSRVMTTPQHVKHFMSVLKKNVEMYEKQHGEIKTTGPNIPADKGVGFKKE